eukprot:829589-Pelagomonas_calceolata.AAC.9
MRTIPASWQNSNKKDVVKVRSSGIQNFGADFAQRPLHAFARFALCMNRTSCIWMDYHLVNDHLKGREVDVQCEK